MSTTVDTNTIENALSLMKRFAKRTGIANKNGTNTRRYLWTDAFALLNFLALKNLNKDEVYDDQALRLIKQVHYNLGKFAPDDSREGWISSLPEEKAENHPTIGGLRIGKKLPERKKEQLYDQRLEWDRDGQYYHYHTRWIHALLKAGSHFESKKLSEWAAELSLTGSQFIIDKEGDLSMYWKMSVDLSRPLVPVMGAHDPLEGLICALQAKEISNSYKEDFDIYIEKLKKLCDRSDWGTDDALGIGSLLLNVISAAELEKKIDLPDSISTKRLLRDAEQSLNAFYESYEYDKSADQRLAFRECGLSLGLRCLEGNLDLIEQHGLIPNIDSEIWSLAREIEEYWLQKENTDVASFQDHLDINVVSLAASLLASVHPETYTSI